MPKHEFKPTHYLDVTSIVSLHIEIVKENGECFIYGAYYDSLDRRFDKVTKSTVRTNKFGHVYFIKSSQRYYLADFIRKTPF